MRIDFTYEREIRRCILRNIPILRKDRKRGLVRDFALIAGRMRELGVPTAPLDLRQMVDNEDGVNGYDQYFPAAWDGPFCAAVGNDELLYLRIGLAKALAESALPALDEESA